VSQSWARKLKTRGQMVWRKPFITGKKQKAVFEEETREFHTSAMQDIGEFKQKCNILNIDEMHLHGKPTQARNVIVTMAFAKSGRPIYKFYCNVDFHITLVSLIVLNLGASR